MFYRSFTINPNLLIIDHPSSGEEELWKESCGGQDLTVKSLDSTVKSSLGTFETIHGNQGSLTIIFNKKEFTGHLSTI